MKKIISILMLVMMLLSLNIGLAEEEDGPFISSSIMTDDKLIYAMSEWKGEKRYIIKILAYDHNNNLLWSYDIPNPFTAFRFQLANDDEYIYALGNNKKDNFSLLKFNNKGECIDEKTFDNLYEPVLSELGMFDSNHSKNEIFFINHAGEKKIINTKGIVEFVKTNKNNIVLSLHPYKDPFSTSKLICTDTDFNYLWSYKPNRQVSVYEMKANNKGDVVIYEYAANDKKNIKLFDKDGKLKFERSFKKNLVSSVGLGFINDDTIYIMGRLYPNISEEYTNIYEINLDLNGNIIKSVKYDYKDANFIIKKDNKYYFAKSSNKLGELGKLTDISQLKTEDIKLLK